MAALIFQIISADKTICCRWKKAFENEGWPVVVAACCSPGGKDCAGHAEMDLIEIGVPDCKNPEDLRCVLKERQPVSTVVFGDPSKISNSQISALLEAGADDFVYKNLDERVLVAKIKAHIRRIMPVIAEAAGRTASSSGAMRIDRIRRAVTIESRAGKFIELANLTPKEFDILYLLVGQEQRVVTRESMLEKIWGDNAAEVYSECVDKHIESLRKKLGFYGKMIKTVYGSGYMFTGEEKA